MYEPRGLWMWEPTMEELQWHWQSTSILLVLWCSNPIRPLVWTGYMGHLEMHWS